MGVTQGKALLHFYQALLKASCVKTSNLRTICIPWLFCFTLLFKKLSGCWWLLLSCCRSQAGNSWRSKLFNLTISQLKQIWKVVFREFIRYMNTAHQQVILCGTRPTDFWVKSPYLVHVHHTGVHEHLSCLSLLFWCCSGGSPQWSKRRIAEAHGINVRQACKLRVWNQSGK